MNCRARFLSVTGQLYLCFAGTKSTPRPFGDETEKAPTSLSLCMSQQKTHRVHAWFCSCRVKLPSGTFCRFFPGAGHLEFTYFQTADGGVAHSMCIRSFHHKSVCNPAQAGPKLCQLLGFTGVLLQFGDCFPKIFFLGTTQTTSCQNSKEKINT